ncbi:hypothetical protein L6164_035380 [Bauhinia variegata]|uniref:Uncharacterized protein n=1 Tax=Bauhinia variegata TaxID=167791 RepID=A0ACB9KDT4_BAUVA|nr:hypothetical protein L6164_035380 [Bauhinia variegata]
MINQNGGNSQAGDGACALCRHQRRTCSANCGFREFFPAERFEEFQNAYKLFGVSNIIKMMESVEPEQRRDCADSILTEANIWNNSPAGHGCLAYVQNLVSQVRSIELERDNVNRLLAFFRATRAHRHSVSDSQRPSGSESQPSEVVRMNEEHYRSESVHRFRQEGESSGVSKADDKGKKIAEEDETKKPPTDPFSSVKEPKKSNHMEKQRNSNFSRSYGFCHLLFVILSLLHEAFIVSLVCTLLRTKTVGYIAYHPNPKSRSTNRVCLLLDSGVELSRGGYIYIHGSAFAGAVSSSGMSNMDIGMGGTGNSRQPGESGDIQEASSSHKRKKSSKRHSEQQIQVLESFFKECPHPDKDQQRQLSRMVGLEQQQIKFWFQNKRTHTKALFERSSNDALRAENENINDENLGIKEVLKTLKCKSCAGSVFPENRVDQHILQSLQQENALLKQEHEKVCSLLSAYTGKPITELVALASALGSTLDLLSGISSNDHGNGNGSSSGLELNFGSSSGAAISGNNIVLDYCLRGITSKERAVMLETATSATKELVRLLDDDILWVKSQVDGRLVLRCDVYEEIFPNTNYHLKSSSAHLESSKDSRIVSMSAMQLVDMFLDSDKWVDLFPTIVTKAKTIEVLQIGLPENRDGALQLMYEQIHVLSPLVPPREFFFLRHCQQIKSGIWVIMDVSIDDLRENASRPRLWKLPSGCMIQETPNGTSMVTWVEHVEVDEKTQSHSLYRELLGSGIAFGAERWVVTLERMCERFEYSFRESIIASQEALGVISLPEGRRSIAKLANRMVKNFSEMLNMSGKQDCPEAKSSHGVQVSVCRNTEAGKPGGVIVSMATSLWLPLPYQAVFDFLKDETKRAQWDVLCDGKRPHEIARISNGVDPRNCTSIIQPFNLSEMNLLILQETCIDPLGCVLVYAPIDMTAINVAMCGRDSSKLPILASGFLIGPTSPNASPSLLTVAFQILISTSLSTKELNMELVAAVNALLCSTVHKIKLALNYSGLD